MKKIVLRMLAMCLCLSAGATLAACSKEEHKHTYSVEWSQNTTHHWRECTGKDCTEISSEAAHVWNDGEVTTMPSADANGEKIFTCLVCGATKGVPIAFACVSEEAASTDIT